MIKQLNDIYANLENCPQKLFLVSEQGSINYSRLLTLVRHFVGLFEQQGLEPGQRVLICSSDDEFIATATAATFFHGLVAIVLTPDTSLARLDSIITQAQASLLCIDEQLQLAWQLEGTFKVFTLTKSKANSSSILKRFKRKAVKSWQTELENYPQLIPALPSELDSNCFLNFTSGTTGLPKGVQISYRNLLTHLQTLGDVFGYAADSRILNNMILAHADGLLQGPLLAIYYSCSVYRPYSMDVQHLEPLLNTVYRDRITHMITVPTILSFIDRLTSHNDYFQGDDFCQLISVAGMLDTHLWKRLEQRFSLRICNIYGLTETVSGGIFCGPKDSHFLYGSIGKPIDMDIKVIDEHGNAVGIDKPGELYVKGQNVFNGYFNALVQTAQVFSNGWFHTGDIARIDENGFVHICGRSKELIITGGFNVHPAEVTEALMRHPDIAEAATLGLPDPDWQETVVAAVVLTNNGSFDERALVAHCRQWLEPQKVPRRIHVLNHLTRGDSGKVKLAELRAQLQAQEKSLQSHSSTFDEVTLLELAAAAFQVEIHLLSIHSRSGETPGWDSLGHLNLVLAIEARFNKTMTPQQIMSIETLQDVMNLFNE